MAASLAMFLLGSIYAYGVFLPVFMTSFGWSRSIAALPHSVLLFVYAIGMGIGGALQDRTSPTQIATAGGVLFALGLVLASRSESLLGLVMSYGVLGGIGFGFAYVAAVTAVMKSFPDRRGMAAGLVVGAFGLGAFVWAPLAQSLLATLTWPEVLQRFGALTLLALPLLGLLIRAPWHPHDVPGTHPQAAGFTLGGALHTSVFWTLFAAYTLVTGVGLFLIAHFINFGRAQGLSAVTAALLVSMLSVGSGLGRIIMGWLSDHLGRFPALIGASLLAVLLLVLLAIVPSSVMIFLGAFTAGYAFGTWLTLYGPTATDLFGLRAAGAIYGTLYLSYGLGGLAGPTLGGLLADTSGSYRLPLVVGAVLCALGAGLFWLTQRLTTRLYAHLPAWEEEYPV